MRVKPLPMNFLPPGTRLGKYEVIRGVATGGMAELYVARCKAMRDFRRLVALKRILPHYASADEFVGMFMDEARLAAKIQHPHVAQVYDIGVDVDGLFYTMELIRGEDLRTILKTAELHGEPLPLDLAIAIVVAAAGGLHAAHEQSDEYGRPLGIVHRDVSPSNVLVSFDGDVKLIDFGVAKARGRKTKTRDGTIKGKVAYMSPEQCRGEEIDRRSDVFAMGILLYELTTTTRLFFGENDFATLRQIIHDDVPPPSTRVPGYPPELEAIVMRALHRDLTLRYQSADELRRDLLAFAQKSQTTDKMSLGAGKLAMYMRAKFPSSFQAWEALRRWEDESGVFTSQSADDGMRPEFADTKPATSAPVEAALALLQGSKGANANASGLEAAEEDDDIPILVDSRPIRLARRRRVQPAPVLAVAALAVAVWALSTRGGGGFAGADNADQVGTQRVSIEPVAPAGELVSESIAVQTNVADNAWPHRPTSALRSHAADVRMLLPGPIARTLAAIQSWAAPVFAPMRAVPETTTMTFELTSQEETQAEQERSSKRNDATKRAQTWDPDSALPPM